MKIELDEKGKIIYDISDINLNNGTSLKELLYTENSNLSYAVGGHGGSGGAGGASWTNGTGGINQISQIRHNQSSQSISVANDGCNIMTNDSIYRISVLENNVFLLNNSLIKINKELALFKMFMHSKGFSEEDYNKFIDSLKVMDKLSEGQKNDKYTI